MRNRTFFYIFFFSILSMVAVASDITRKETVTVTDGTLFSNARINVDVELTTTGESRLLLVEMQPIKGPCSRVFSFTANRPPCDPAYPSNVIGGGQLDKYSPFKLRLSSTISESGTYCVKLLSVDSCCPANADCQALEPYGWGTDIKEVYVNVPTAATGGFCGDGVCRSNENTASCAKDCPGYCGDAVCGNNPTRSEDASWCRDCSESPSAPEHCGTGVCQPDLGETSQTCAKDCRVVTVAPSNVSSVFGIYGLWFGFIVILGAIILWRFA